MGTVVENADQQLSHLHAEQARFIRAIAEVESQLHSSSLAREEHQQARADAQRAQAEAEKAHRAAVAYAGLAKGTPGEESASRPVASTKKALQKAQQVCERLEQENNAAIATEQALNEKRDALIQQLQALQCEHEAFETARAKAHDEIGQEKYRTLLQSYQQVQTRLGRLASEQQELQTCADALYQSGCEGLADWPAIRERFAAVRPYEDANTRVLCATIAYAHAMGENGPSVDSDAFPTIWELVLLPPAMLQVYYGLLQERAQLLEQRVQEYRTLAREERNGICQN